MDFLRKELIFVKVTEHYRMVKKKKDFFFKEILGIGCEQIPIPRENKNPPKAAGQSWNLWEN